MHGRGYFSSGPRPGRWHLTYGRGFGRTGFMPHTPRRTTTQRVSLGKRCRPSLSRESIVEDTACRLVVSLTLCFKNIRSGVVDTKISLACTCRLSRALDTRLLHAIIYLHIFLFFVFVLKQKKKKIVGLLYLLDICVV